MKRKTAGRVAKPRICALCGGALAEKKPTYLIASGNGRIAGPYHSGCAAKLAMEAKRQHKKEPRGFESAETFGKVVREETLPW